MIVIPHSGRIKSPWVVAELTIGTNFPHRQLNTIDIVERFTNDIALSVALPSAH